MLHQSKYFLAMSQSESRVSSNERNYDFCHVEHIAGEVENIWIPNEDREKLDWSVIPNRFEISLSLPNVSKSAQRCLSEIDVIWIDRGSNKIKALYEVEHSTPVYSGLLRFNDIYLTSVAVERFTIVSNEERRSVFARQINRPTFIRSGLCEICSFLNYANVYSWHQRLVTH